MRDYTFLYREELSHHETWNRKWGLFISAYDTSERVQFVFKHVEADVKHWIVHCEYGFSPDLTQIDNAFWSDELNEGEYILSYFDSMLSTVDLSTTRVCVDVTGFMRPHLMFLVKLLFSRGATVVDVIYAEPAFYKNKEKTKFSVEQVREVRQVVGFEGVTNNDTSNDLLIIGAGYETHLIEEVAEDKDKARKMIVLGFPSLSADMYQQNAWRTRLAVDAVGESAYEKHFAPANDPFVTATKLSELVDRERRRSPPTNIYLSPLATKAQAVGFVLYYLSECQNESISIIFPYSDTYEPGTSRGVARIWCYTVETLPNS